MLPFIQIDFLWRTGLAGAIVSGLSYIIAVFFMHRLLKLLTKSSIISIFGTTLFALNPNLLYLQAIPLDEALAVMTTTVSMYYLLVWSKTKSIPGLVTAALFALLGSLVRYELWFLLFAQTVFILIASISDKEVSNRVKKAEGFLVLFSSLAFFGIALWFLYNFLGWGDPLYFLHHTGGHIDQQKEFEALGLLTTKGNIVISFKVLLSNILESIGPALLITTMSSLVYILIRKDSIKNKLYHIVPMAPLGFLLLSLFFGITVLFTKMYPEPISDKVFNVRYGIIAIVPAVIIVSSGLAHLAKETYLKWLAYISMTAIILLDAYYFAMTTPPTVIEDGRNGISAYGQFDEAAIATSVKENCDNTLILISANQDEIIMFEAGFPMKSYVYEGSDKHWDQALQHPDTIVGCILMAKKGEIYKTFQMYPQRLSNYTLIHTSNSGDTLLYKIN